MKPQTREVRRIFIRGKMLSGDGVEITKGRMGPGNSRKKDVGLTLTAVGSLGDDRMERMDKMFG